MPQQIHQIDYERVSPFVMLFTKVLGVQAALKLHRAICSNDPNHRTMLRSALRLARASGVSV